MTASDGFIAYVRDLLDDLRPIAVRRMFGGAGIFREGLMFALILDDTLYLRADDSNRGDFEAEGLTPFSYETKSGRNTILSYWRCPDRLFDDPDEMAVWARKALAAARKAAAKPVAGKRARRKS
jgi:DNA transformation protein